MFRGLNLSFLNDEDWVKALALVMSGQAELHEL